MPLRSLFVPRLLLMMFVGLKAIGLSAAEAEAFLVPPMIRPVQDDVGVLNPQTVSKLSSVLQNLHNSGGSQIAVLIVPTLGNLSVEEATIKVTDVWKLGTQGKDNGVLLLIAPNDRRVRIEVGKGLEGDLTDAYARRIINEVIKPAFKQNDYDGGVTAAVANIISITDPNFDLQGAGVKSRRSSSRDVRMGPVQGLGFLIIVAIMIIGSMLLGFLRMIGILPRSSYYRGSNWRGGGFGGFGGGGGFGSGGGGSWGGGGGGFSGGGSSGQW